MTASPSSDLVAPWRRWSGYVVVAALAGTLVWLSFRPTGTTATPAPITSGSVPVVSEFPDSTPGQAPSTDAPSVSASQEVLASLDGALAGWGRFAVSGDLADVEEGFWADGPQWSNLEIDAARIERSTGAAYSVTVRDPEVDVTADAASVVAAVTFERPGEATQEYAWTIDLVRRDGVWRIWAITTTP